MLRGEELKRQNAKTAKCPNAGDRTSPAGAQSTNGFRAGVRRHLARYRATIGLRYCLFAISTPAILLAAGAMPEWASTAWSYILLILGFSLVIFVHELGHFAAAKWAGVRVERFAIGFGKELLGFTRAETRYSFNVLPFGGYVKMLGQEDFVVDKSGELKVKENPDSFTNKSIGQRMVIISAGVIMNLIFAAIAFGIVVMVGRPQWPSVVGTVIPGSPAAGAGLQTGDRIIAVNDKEVKSFGELSAAIMLSDQGEELVLDVLRDGKPVTPKPTVLPAFNENQETRQIGVSPGMNLRAWLPSLRGGSEPGPNELHQADELYAVVENGVERPCKDLGEFRKVIVGARGAPVELVVNRPNEPDKLSMQDLLKSDLKVESKRVRITARALWTVVPENPAELGTGSLLGFVPRVRVLHPDENKSFALAGVRQGDVIAKLGSQAYPDYATVKKTIEAGAGEQIALEVSRPYDANGELSAAIVRFCVAHRESFIAAAIKSLSDAAGLIESKAADAGLTQADREKLTQHVASMKTPVAMRKWLESVDIHKLDPLVPKAPFSLFGSGTPPTIDATLAPMDDEHLIVAAVVNQADGRPSPAKAAGIPAGAALVSCDGKPLSSWSELSRIFEDSAGKTVELTYRVVDEIKTTKFDVPMCVTASLGIPPGARIVKIDGKSSFSIKGADGEPHELALPDWRAIRVGFSGMVGRTVTVEYVTREGASAKGEYAVAEDNIDPWLQRVFYTEPFICYQLVERNRVENPIAAVAIGFQQAYDATLQTVLALKHMIFTRQVGLSKVSGPVGMIRHGGAIAQSGAVDLLWYLALISANLAVINFLPMPIVDGGLFLFLVLEKIRGEPVSIKTQVATQLVGIALIATVFILVTYQDIKNWITGA